MKALHNLIVMVGRDNNMEALPLEEWPSDLSEYWNLDLLNFQAKSLTEDEADTFTSGGLSEVVVMTAEKQILPLHSFLNAAFDGPLTDKLYRWDSSAVEELHITDMEFGPTDGIRNHLIEVLDWFEAYQIDDSYPYSEEPDFVKSAKALWIELYGKEDNPKSWPWVSSHGFSGENEPLTRNLGGEL